MDHSFDDACEVCEPKTKVGQRQTDTKRWEVGQKGRYNLYFQTPHLLGNYSRVGSAADLQARLGWVRLGQVGLGRIRSD